MQAGARQLEKHQVLAHNGAIQLFELVRDSILVSISADGQLLLSEVRYPIQQQGAHNDTPQASLHYKMIPNVPQRASIHQLTVTRTQELRQSLDLLTFELLNGLFQLQQISQTQVDAQNAVNRTQMA